ncbi:hypothetical protein BDW74DRAFT_144651 [Aspergillus multicolor]|uniref:uncharacterized protein n=1 Tax=Aspergillus multicolor TaxID=41759 RepID=UPI003CCD8767
MCYLNAFPAPLLPTIIAAPSTNKSVVRYKDLDLLLGEVLVEMGNGAPRSRTGRPCDVQPYLDSEPVRSRYKCKPAPPTLRLVKEATKCSRGFTPWRHCRHRSAKIKPPFSGSQMIEGQIGIISAYCPASLHALIFFLALALFHALALPHAPSSWP